MKKNGKSTRDEQYSQEEGEPLEEWSLELGAWNWGGGIFLFSPIRETKIFTQLQTAAPLAKSNHFSEQPREENSQDLDMPL